MKKLILVVIGFMVPSLVLAAGGSNEHVVPAPINVNDKVSLQKGAQIFLNNCLGCHNARLMRYERMADDLDIPHDIVLEEMVFTDSKIGEHMLNAMPEDLAKKWFGTTPPDLTLEARYRGEDWLYSYLISFYDDASRPFGVNNKVFPDVGMPHVLADMEQELGEEGFKAAMADLTNFMVYMSEPVRAERESLGRYVLLFIAFLAIPIYFLNREYWKDVH